MCGIAGICRFDDRVVSRDDIVRMTKVLSHRGPDGEGIYLNPSGHTALGHRRLSIIDLSIQGKQPMTNEDGTLQIVFNGEIYNYLELKKGLESRGHLFVSDTDTEVILHLFEEKGAQCVHELRGMFAFAIWNEKNQSIFIARDRLGKKPLYYSLRNNCLWFASEINSIMTISNLCKEIDCEAIDAFFALLYIPSPLSIFKDVKKLQPAHYLYMHKKEIKIEKYWSLNFMPKFDLTFDEAQLVLKEKLQESVRLRLRSDVPVGCMLSGGVDSSVVAITMAKLSSSPIRTFSIAFEENEFNEAPYAKLVADICSSKHTEYLVRPNTVDILPKIVRHYGEPFGDSSALPTWYLSEVTRKQVTVSLSGDGGDELFAGYLWYKLAMRYRNIKRVLPSSAMQTIAKLFGMKESRTGILRKVAKLAKLLSMDDDKRFASLRLVNEDAIRKTIYTTSFASEINKTPVNYLADFYKTANAVNDLDRYLFVDTMSYLPEELLVKVDRSSMAHSLECRAPLLDQDFVEFAARLPVDYKLRGATEKFILKESFKEFFPKGFLHRKKQGFSVPLNSWFRNELRSYVYDIINSKSLRELGVLNIDAVMVLVDEHMKGARNYQDLIWNCLILAEWVSQNNERTF